MFVHPRVVKDPALHEVLASTLSEAGVLVDGMKIGPADLRGRHELVTFIRKNEDGSDAYERQDGVRYQHGLGDKVPA